MKWTLLSTQGRRSIFQADEGGDPTIAAVEEAQADDVVETNQPAADDQGRVRLQGVTETYFAAASGPYSYSYEGVNFAFALPASEQIAFIFSGQTGMGTGAPQRFETPPPC